MGDPGDRLVVGQGAALLALLWPGPARWPLPAAVRVGVAATGAAGLALSGAAAAAHGRSLTPRVTPPDGAALLESGPYAVSRHPVYAGLLVTTAAWALLRRRPEPLGAWAALLVVLLAKTRREEGLLEARFGDAYRAYRARTPYLLGRPRSHLHR